MATCTTATYGERDDGDISVTNRAWLWWFFFRYFEIEGKARCDENGQCRVDFQEGADLEGRTNYNVLSTDYDNYSLVYSCEDTWYGKFELLWILTRNTDDTAETIEEYNQLVRDILPGDDHYGVNFWTVNRGVGGWCKYPDEE